MSIEKQEWGFYINCDGCSEYYMHDIEGDFLGAILAVKEIGWRLRKDKDGNWEHFCPMCVDKGKHQEYPKEGM